MYDQSYNAFTLSSRSILKKGDFRKIPKTFRDAYRKTIVDDATKSAHSIFDGKNPIHAFHLKKKSAYKIRSLKDDLVVRKLALNLKRLTRLRTPGRSFVISNLRHFLEEGIPYRVYRLDVKSFYESFLIEDIKAAVSALRSLTPLSKRHLTALLDHYAAIGGKGLPRGMGISAVLSNWLMSNFDSEMNAHPAVYFYGRYVDDITIVTNRTEDEAAFLSKIGEQLPTGLRLNEKKTSVHACDRKLTPVAPPAKSPIPRFNLSYLGYQFSVLDPVRSNKTNRSEFRLVRVEIAPEKIQKIKQRIVRSFIAFKSNRDDSLLVDRIKFLTSNFSVYDKNSGKRQLSGIFYSYPLLSEMSESLAELDQFLKNAVLSKRGRLFSATAPLLSSTVKRRLLSLSFTHGHMTRHFMNFSPRKIHDIQECWIYE
ncbi:MAG: RNA-directed DNA polymerase [Betaproteobacteria bacterium]|nr:RNA-directed DNA polymerase [Betaproteobacteria bacterium]